jgi:predicted TIM-barrel fold metal-dependent hydrolase
MSQKARQRAWRLVDCDIHNTFRGSRDLTPYLSEPWKSRYNDGGLGYPGTGYYSEVGVLRRDAAGPDGGPAGSDPVFVAKHLLDTYGIDAGVLNGAGILGVSLLTDPDYAAALATAYNDWLVDTWLNVDPRYFGSLVIATQDAELAAREIDRLGDHPRIVQVMMASASRDPYGQRRFHPIYAAAERHGLPVAIHPGTEGSGIANPPTAAGYPRSYLEWHTCLSQNFQAHLVSLIAEGVFVKYPTLHFVLVEGGVSWLAPLLWRMDKNYKALRAEVPWLTKLPSEYAYEHVRLSTQPIEEPPDPAHLLQVFAMMHAEQVLMYSSDYPHWDFDSPTAAFPPLPKELKQRVFADNAVALYRLDERLDTLAGARSLATASR